MDARIVRTRRSLQQALFDLAREKGIDHVAVGEIAERAGVNRSTFYQHYSDKETLLADAFDLVAEEAGAQLEGIDEQSADPPRALVDFLAHIDTHADLYRRVFLEPGYGVVLARLREHIHRAVHGAAQESARKDPEVPLDVLAAGVAGSIIGVIGAWLGREPHASVDEAALWVWRVLLGPADAT
ncbi:TetR/AcrR family transcriptional regulator [Demequina activiva]|uniref:TetR family transcriptional regulator n=1 Tax=Demequina activiva TaxID=1582364 RepID=A0A919UFB2_9MICO|nr:TetR/AcrR family transcriptional regulator [Demequina activiva]GIG53487.1 TetR family transcriptional regulator [Demequina activiva]